MEQQNQSRPQQHTVVIVGKPKSVGVAIVLTFLFGPLGLLYASVAGGIIMIILGFLIGIITLGLGFVVAWVVSIIWAVVAVNLSNKKLVN